MGRFLIVLRHGFGAVGGVGVDLAILLGNDVQLLTDGVLRAQTLVLCIGAPSTDHTALSF